MFKLAPSGNGQVFALTGPDLRIPGIPDDMLQQVLSSLHGQCVMAAHSLLRFFAAGDTLSCLSFTMTAAESVHIDAGGSANLRCRFDLLQDVADQVR